MKNTLLTIVGILSTIVVILLMMLFRQSPKMGLSEKSLSGSEVMMLMLDPKNNKNVVIFVDTRFDFDQSEPIQVAKILVDKDVQDLKENPLIKVRMAGNTSGNSAEEINLKLLSEIKANAVREYLIVNEITPERSTTIGYGRIKMAVYEVAPGDIHSNEEMATISILSEILVR